VGLGRTRDFSSPALWPRSHIDYSEICYRTTRMIRIFAWIVGALLFFGVCIIASVLLQYVDTLDMMGY